MNGEYKTRVFNAEGRNRGQIYVVNIKTGEHISLSFNPNWKSDIGITSHSRSYLIVSQEQAIRLETQIPGRDIAWSFIDRRNLDMDQIERLIKHLQESRGEC